MFLHQTLVGFLHFCNVSFEGEAGGAVVHQLFHFCYHISEFLNFHFKSLYLVTVAVSSVLRLPALVLLFDEDSEGFFEFLVLLLKGKVFIPD